MKPLLPLVISLVFISTLVLSGCGEVDRSGELREFLSANEETFSQSFTEEPCEFTAFADYMTTWADANKIDIAYQGEHSMVLHNKATKGYDDEPSTVLLCDFDISDPQSNQELISTAQAMLLGPEDHGSISLAVTEFDGSRMVGITEIPSDYIKSDNLINLKTGNDNTILVSGPNAADALFHRSGSTAQSTYAQAFKITFSMPEYTNPYDFSKSSNYPNPINTIGSFLATNKSSGRLFDIASFTSKTHKLYSPYYAKAVIVVDSNHIESFKSKFEKSYENIKDKFEDLDAEFEYTMEETDMPDSVLSDDIADNLVSLMYTLNTGICQQAEESGLIFSSSYIKSINTDNGNLDLIINMRTRGESYLDSLSSEYETTAGLCSTKYSCKKDGRLWSSDAKSSLVTYFTSCVPLQGESEEAVSVKVNENDIISRALPNQNMIIYSFEKGDRKTVLENVINFLDPSVQK